jgi:hypothetical protein
MKHHSIEIYDAEGIEDMLVSSEDINKKDFYIDESVKILHSFNAN